MYQKAQSAMIAYKHIRSRPSSQFLRHRQIHYHHDYHGPRGRGGGASHTTSHLQGRTNVDEHDSNLETVKAQAHVVVAHDPADDDHKRKD